VYRENGSQRDMAVFVTSRRKIIESKVRIIVYKQANQISTIKDNEREKEVPLQGL